MNRVEKRYMLGKVVQFCAALLIYALFITFVVVRVSTNNFNIGIIFEYKDMLIGGLCNTLITSGCSLVLGMILGFILYIMQKSRAYIIKSIANIFIEVIMGTPLLVLVFITSYFIGTAFNNDNDYLLGILAITAYMGPYMTNIYKSVINSIDKDQFIVMELYGFTKYQKYRYIILPQIIRPLMPPLMNNLSYIIKGSSLLYLTAVTEIFYSIKLIQSLTFAFTEGYLVLWGAYLIITIPLSLLTRYVEKRFAS
jgi:polar amino acid transport system permease protein